MSCGCSNNVNYPCGCGSSSCTSCSSTSCEQIVYTGPNLNCSGINNNDNLCVALQKLDDIVCNPSGLTVTASNGLYKDLLLNDIRMGGALTETTTIGTSNTNTLSITGLATDQDPLYVLVQTNLGVIRKSLVSTITDSILAILTADNGLSYTSTNVQLGGSLIKPTTITAGPTNTLSIAGLVLNPSATYVVSVNSSTGLLTKTAISNIVPTITASNGLTKTGDDVKLGGTITANTFVELNQKILYLKDTVYASPTGFTIVPGNDPTTSDLDWTKNYISYSGKNIFNSFSWFTNNVGIGIKPQPTTSAIVTSNSRLTVYKSTGYTNNPIAVSVDSTLDMYGALGSGGTSIYAANFGNLKWGPTSNQSISTIGSLAGNSSYLSLVSANDTTGGNLSSTAAQVYTAAASNIFISGVSSSGGTITVPNTTDMTYIQPGYQVILKSGSGNLGYVNTYVDTVNAGAFTFTIKRISGGSRSSWNYLPVTPLVPLSAASIVVAKANSGNDLGSVDLAIGSRILAPAPDSYAGSSVRIDSIVGLQIEDQLDFIPNPYDAWDPAIDLTPGYISEAYGIKQIGTHDKNLFNAIINNLPNLPVYANNSAAVSGGLAVGTIYRTSTGELRIVI